MVKLNNEKLKELRGGRSLQEIGDRLGVSRQTVFQYEAGQMPNPTISVLYRLATAYGVADPHELILTDDQPAAA